MLCINFLIFETDTTSKGQTYYIDNSKYCDDKSAGTTPKRPWCNLSNVNDKLFFPGDKILLARGKVWNNQSMNFNERGTKDAPITIGSYGQGPRPKIVGDNGPHSKAIHLTNASHWSIGDLEISNYGTGILFYYTTPGHDGIKLSNIFVHHINGIVKGIPQDPYNINFSSGIYFTAKTKISVPNNQFIIKNITMDHIEGSRNQDSIAIDWNNGTIGPSRGATNVIMNHLYLHDDNGDGRSSSCSDSLRIVNSAYVTIMNSVIDNVAACHSKTGTAAVFLAKTTNLTLVNNIIRNVPETGSHDQTGIDFEYQTKGINIFSNYFANNAGPAMEFLGIHGPNDYNQLHNITGNIFSNNGGGAIKQVGLDIVPSGTISNNVYFGKKPFLTTSSGGSFEKFLSVDNQITATRSSTHVASSSFTNQQNKFFWSYQSKNNNAWSELAVYNVYSKVWKDQQLKQELSQFESTPGQGACGPCTVARVWTAPSDGLINIRGRALMSYKTGDGAVIRITKNGNRIWPANGDYSLSGNDQFGINTFIDNVQVQANDTIRFEVENKIDDKKKDVVSWSPAIVYIEDTPGIKLEKASWIPVNQSKIISNLESNSTFSLLSSGADPYIAASANIPAFEYKVVEVTLKNDTNSTMAQLFFKTNKDQAYSEQNSRKIKIKQHSGQYHKYRFDMSEIPTWTGIITDLRLDPITTTGNVHISSIEFKKQ